MSSGGDMMLDMAERLSACYDAADGGDDDARQAIAAIVQGAAAGNADAILMRRTLDYLAAARGSSGSGRPGSVAGAPVFGGYGMPRVHQPGFGAQGVRRLGRRPTSASRGMVSVGGYPLSGDQKTALIALLDAAALSPAPSGGDIYKSQNPMQGQSAPPSGGQDAITQALIAAHKKMSAPQQRALQNLTAASSRLSAANMSFASDNQLPGSHGIYGFNPGF